MDARRRTAAKEPAIKATNLRVRSISTQTDKDQVKSVPHEECHLLLRELVDVDVGNWVGETEATREEVRKLVELAELPFGVGRVLASTDGGRVVAVLLR